MMMRLIIGLVATMTLAACQDSVSTEVTRFSALPDAVKGQSFTIIPEGAQIGSLEFQRNAELAAARMSDLGFVPLPPAKGATPDLVVLMRYGEMGARTEIDSGPDFSLYGGTGYWGPRWGYWGGAPVYRSRSVALYGHRLDLDIWDGAAFRRGERVMVFQGRVIGESHNRDNSAAMPAMMTALFQNFPGSSGETVRISVPVSEN